MSNTVIEIDGYKISPDFLNLITSKLSGIKANAEEFKRIIFDAQVGIMSGIASDNCIPQNLSELNYGLQQLYYFFDELTQLINDGKF